MRPAIDSIAKFPNLAEHFNYRRVLRKITTDYAADAKDTLRLICGSTGHEKRILFGIPLALVVKLPDDVDEGDGRLFAAFTQVLQRDRAVCELSVADDGDAIRF